MKKFVFAILFFPFLVFSQTDKKACEILNGLNTIIQKNHYKPKPIDDSLSVYVFKTFLNRLDEDNRLFLNPEIEQLKSHEYKIDDYILTKNCNFLHDFYVSYTNAISRYSSIISNLKNESFPMSSSEKIVFSKKAFPYLNDENELKHLYKKRILFSILREIAELSSNRDSLNSNFESLASQYKNKVFEKYECKTSGYLLSEIEFNSIFYSTFCSYFDPHTDYFSENDKSSFYSNVSSDNMTFGFYTSMNEKDEMTVNEIIPGSSAYFSEKINIGDQLFKIKYKNEEYEIDCSSMKKIEEIISSNDYKKADFTFRKKTGEIYKVQLEKKIMKDYQNNVYSFKLKKDNSLFGYIKIPSFYSTFENGKSSVSLDVANEIFKLQNEQLDGLIIDLENNGGGSMEEAVRLSGFFINDGPLAVMNNNKNRIETIKVLNRGTIYNGPILILINGFSASASEFFAMTLQDYNRAIIVGNNSLGKATMQRIIPLNNKKDSFLKLTLEKFYRITGKSNQYIGITPDIEIPSLFDNQLPREKSNETALKNDQLLLKIKYNYLSKSIYNEAITISNKRITSSKYANEIKDLNTVIDPLFEKELPPITLQFEDVFNDVNKINQIWKNIKSFGEKEFPIEVESNSIDFEEQKTDEFLISNSKERIKNIKQNFHILEAINIMNDIIHIKP